MSQRMKPGKTRRPEHFGPRIKYEKSVDGLQAVFDKNPLLSLSGVSHSSTLSPALLPSHPSIPPPSLPLPHGGMHKRKTHEERERQ